MDEDVLLYTYGLVVTGDTHTYVYIYIQYYDISNYFYMYM